jgi:ATP-dependent helicase/nuclease subunit B
VTLFAEPGPRVFAAPPGRDFSAALAAGLRARLGDAPPEAAARVTLLLNTRRAARAVEAAWEASAPGAAAMAPRIGALDALGGPLDRLAPCDLPPPVEPTARLLTLTRLVAEFLRRRPGRGPIAAASALARSLGGLIDELNREGVPFEALRDAAPAEHAAHWDELLDFLRIALEAWPTVLAAEDRVEAEARRRAAVEAACEAWRAAPPAQPLIVAGSTGSVGTTRLLMRAVARAPQGALVLPGFDPEAAAEVWDGIEDGHPYAGFRRLLRELELPLDAVAPWEDAPAPRPERRRLLHQALRPPPVTDGWLAAARALGGEAEAATAGLTLIEASDPRREALAVALTLREALETPGRRAALITPDRTLARRVSAALKRWEVEPDDSGGRPLALTPPGVFLKLVAGVAFEPWDPVALLALLKHPLCGAGPGRGAVLRAARRLELAVLRPRPEVASPAAVAAAWAERAGEDEGARALSDALARLAALAETRAETLASLAAAHLDCAQALAGPTLWEKEAGAAARAACDAFRAAAEVYGPCAPAEHPALFAACLSGEAREEAFRPDPRIAIWGPLEARAQSRDLIVLAGLNEGVWPAAAEADPWLSREMRAALGLPSPERRMGLAAHDVLVAACAPEVALSRALRAEGSPTVASRWLTRLTTLLGGVSEAALAAMRARGDRLIDWCAPLEHDDAAPERDPRPAPRPPVEARPRQLWVTEVETLIRDPYAVYARRVLGLRPLDPVGREADARDRGIALHDAMHAFVRNWEDGADPAPRFRAAVERTLAASHAPEALRRLWRARLDRLEAALLEEEAARREACEGPPLCELAGARPAPERRFTLRARADRVDRLRDGSLALYDYKTGRIPTRDEIAAFAKQLPLTAAIAGAGGFAECGAARVSRLAHISLGTGEGAGRAAEAGDEPEDLAEAAWDGLMRLIAAYDRPETPYLSRARPRLLRGAGDYDHLARVGAWAEDEA